LSSSVPRRRRRSDEAPPGEEAFRPSELIRRGSLSADCLFRKAEKSFFNEGSSPH